MTNEEKIAELKAEIERLLEEKPLGYNIQVAEYRKMLRVIDPDISN